MHDSNIRFLSFAFLLPTFLLAIVAKEAHSQVIAYPDFSNTAGLTINGDAIGNVNNGIDSNPVLRLARAAESQTGSAFSSDVVNATQFSTFFQFRITQPGGFSNGIDQGADGFVFVVQPVSPRLVGVGGGGLGYEGISPSIGVAFDTYSFSFGANRVDLKTNGNLASLQQVSVSPLLDNGRLWSAWIDYDGTTIEVRVNQSGVRPGTASLAQAMDIPGIIGQDAAFVGFTAATGGAYENFDIVNWEHGDVRFDSTPPDTFVPLGAEWRYLDNGTNQGTAWREAAFDDSTWQAGPAQLGYGDGDEATVVNCGPNSPSCRINNFATTYFRHTFEIEDVDQIESLSAFVLRDDAAAVYLNGEEIFRDDSLPGGAAYNRFARSQGDENGMTAFVIDPSLLIDGENVLAVEVHQVLHDSSDVSFDFRLIGKVTPVPEPSAFLLTAFGLLGLVARGRRRRTRSMSISAV